MIENINDIGEIIGLIDQLVQELSKSEATLKGVGYINNLPKLILLKNEYTANPNGESMRKVYDWILGGNAWPENAILPDNMFIIWNIMSKLRILYEINYIEAETEKGKAQILNTFSDKARMKGINVEANWGPERFGNETFPLAVTYKGARTIIDFPRENIDDYVNDLNVKNDIGIIIDNTIEKLVNKLSRPTP
jgi:hypothetical protein